MQTIKKNEAAVTRKYFYRVTENPDISYAYELSHVKSFHSFNATLCCLFVYIYEDCTM
jgi:hypothetical protein